MEGHHLIYPNLLAKIGGQEVVFLIKKNKCREPKTIPYALHVYEKTDRSWPTCEWSFTPSIMSIDEDVIYPCEIDVTINYMLDFKQPNWDARGKPCDLWSS